MAVKSLFAKPILGEKVQLASVEVDSEGIQLFQPILER